MSWKDLLVYVDEGAALDDTLALAARFAERFEAHVAGLAVVPFRLPLEMSQPSRIRDYGTRMRRRLETLEQHFGKALSRQNGEWRAHDGFTEGGERLEVISRHARYADLILMGQPDVSSDVDAPPVDLPAQVAVASGRPVLAVPHGGWSGAVGDHVVVGWNGSREAARAISDALPLLQTAKTVRVQVFTGRNRLDGHGELPGSDIATMLSRHGVIVEVVRDAGGSADPASSLVAAAKDSGADLIVMGAYGQPRVRELVLGGTTHEMMRVMDRPVLLAH
ncbi:universal stress protein [Arhodomonas aquaeolei]|uniref:universal stress protein n=1 Tax=Arhodomonas aquaeolei TaxID=2369 RepID=UPI00036E9036|nr:universal stress protein [Arhodomonas aquaeolei]